jgi:hypothetical protein
MWLESWDRKFKEDVARLNGDGNTEQVTACPNR